MFDFIAKASLEGPSGHDEMLHKVQLIALKRYKKLKFGLSIVRTLGKDGFFQENKIIQLESMIH